MAEPALPIIRTVDEFVAWEERQDALGIELPVIDLDAGADLKSSEA